jgi:hypothetical protein
MEQKVVKIEIGKVFAVVIAIIAIALVAALFIQSSYFQGKAGRPGVITPVVITEVTQGDLAVGKALRDVRTAILTKKSDVVVGQFIDKLDSETMAAYGFSMKGNITRIYTTMGERGKSQLVKEFNVTKVDRNSAEAISFELESFK